MPDSNTENSTTAGPVRLEVSDNVATVTFDNPPANALSTAAIAALEAATDRLESDDAIRAVIFAAHGNTAFLSGADINELPERMADPAAFEAHTERVRTLFARIATLPQPTIAAVGADAVGGGLEFALLTDLIVAGAKVKFALPEVRLGLIPGAGGTQRLMRRIPVGQAVEMVLLGRSMSAPAALAAGLVNRVTEPEAVLTEARSLAESLAKLPRVAVQAAKRAMREGESAGSLAEGLTAEARAFSNAAASADAQEGCQAFLERRAAVFTHR